MDTMKDSKKGVRRRHSAELKAQVLSECAQPGSSVASVAMSHGINANIVDKWRRLAGAAPLPVASFVPVALPAPTCAAPAEIHLAAPAVVKTASPRAYRESRCFLGSGAFTGIQALNKLGVLSTVGLTWMRTKCRYRCLNR